jgi:hypothetical protein
MSDDMSQYGPDKPCQRTKCVAANAERNPGVTVGDHLGGAHLNPRDRERFDGNGTSLRAASIYVRDDLYALEALKRDEELVALRPGVPEVIDVAIRSTLKHIDFLDRQVAHVRVDMDRQVRRASERALSCEAHGEVIADLERQVTAFEAAERRANAGRLELLGFLTAVDQAVAAWDRNDTLGLAQPTAQGLIEALRKASKKTHAAHQRKWS